MCFEWFTKGQHDLESDVQQQLFKEKILKLEPYEITMNGERIIIYFALFTWLNLQYKRNGPKVCKFSDGLLLIFRV